MQTGRGWVPETFEPVFLVLPNIFPFKMHQQKVLVASDFRNSRTVKIVLVEELEHVEEVEVE